MLSSAGSGRELCMKRFEIQGRKALITGAASGLGRAFALALGEAGASVTGVDRDVDGLAQTNELAKAKGYSFGTIVADVALAPDVDAMISCFSERSSAIDILINNAGIAT